ncbi:MAG TPA: hypothetical protein VHV10_19340 [Ktedonobacteraceae bacterium]|nr:hypothetical protein [Ktedonobacteraceae bacterium]
MFFSPQKIQALRDLQIQREATKEVEQAQKQLVKEQRQQAKIDRQQAAIQKRQQREEQQQLRKAQTVAARAAKQQAKNTLQADKQLNNECQASLKKPKRSKQLNIAPLQQPVFEQIALSEEVPKQAIQRSGRTVRRPRHLDGYQIDI